MLIGWPGVDAEAVRSGAITRESRVACFDEQSLVCAVVDSIELRVWSSRRIEIVNNLVLCEATGLAIILAQYQGILYLD